jgi:UDP-glucose 4-epimerase
MDLHFQKIRALVTGGAGFIGSHLCEELLRLGADVVSLDNYSAGKESNLNGIDCKRIKGDVLDEDLVNRLTMGIDVIFHNAASKKNICLENPNRDLDVNAKGTLNLLRAAVKNGVSKFVHASTGSVYGEPVFLPYDESHPLNPVSYYGVSKLAGERYAMAFYSLHGLNVSVLRYFHVYGPRQESSDGLGGVVSIFARRMIMNQPIVIYGDGSQQRSFTYVGDVVTANLLCAIRTNAVGKVYNCASGIRITVKELADIISHILGLDRYDVVYEDWLPGDIKVFDVDNSKIQSDLGMTFMTDLSNGLIRIIDWTRCHFGASYV